MGPAAARRKTSRATTTPKSAADQIEIDFPYTLVLYTDKTKGVVCTKSIPKKSRSVGTSCKVPNPIDWVSSDDKSKHECFVIDFGRDIDMLYCIRLLKTGLIDPNCNAEEYLAKKREKRENPKSVEERKRENLQTIENVVSGGHVFMKERTIDQSLMSVPSGTSDRTESESVVPNLTTSTAAPQSGSNYFPNLSASSNYLPPDFSSCNASQNPSANSHYLPPDFSQINVSAQNQSANSCNLLPPAAKSLESFDYPTESVSPGPSETSDKVPLNRGSSFSPLNGILVSLAVLNQEQGTNSPEINKENSEEILSDKGTTDESAIPRSPSPLALLNESNTERVSNIFQSNEHSEKILSDAGNYRSQSELVVPDSNSGESNPGGLDQYERPHALQVSEPDHGQLPGQTSFQPPTPSAHHVQLEADTAESTIANTEWAFDVNQLECFQPGGPDEKYNFAPNTKLYIMRSEYCCLPLLHPTKGQKIGNSLNPRQMVTFLIKKLLPEPFRKNVQKTNIPPDFFEAFRTFLNVRLPLEHKEDDASIRLYIYDACRLKKRNRRKEAEAREEKIKNGIPIKKRKGRESTT